MYCHRGASSITGMTNRWRRIQKKVDNNRTLHGLSRRLLQKCFLNTNRDVFIIFPRAKKNEFQPLQNTTAHEVLFRLTTTTTKVDSTDQQHYYGFFSQNHLKTYKSFHFAVSKQAVKFCMYLELVSNQTFPNIQPQEIIYIYVVFFSYTNFFSTSRRQTFLRRADAKKLKNPHVVQEDQLKDNLSWAQNEVILDAPPTRVPIQSPGPELCLFLMRRSLSSSVSCPELKTMSVSGQLSLHCHCIG